MVAERHTTSTPRLPSTLPRPSSLSLSCCQLQFYTNVDRYHVSVDSRRWPYKGMDRVRFDAPRGLQRRYDDGRDRVDTTTAETVKDSLRLMTVLDDTDGSHEDNVFTGIAATVSAPP